MAGHKILIIDDDVITAAAVQEYLSNFGYEIYHAIDGLEGVNMVEKILPDLILLDINMPGKDGFQTLEEIKRTPEFSGIPVIFLSAYDRSNLKVKGLELGADDYITRPFEQAELLARIRVALRRCGRIQKEKNGRTLEGNLSDMGLIDLIQSLDMGKKTAVVKLKDLDGELILENGLLVFARQGSFTGKDALNRILLVEGGGFSVSYDKIPDDIPKQPVQPMKAIMDAVTYIDEIKSMMENLQPGSPVNVTVTPGLKKLKGAEGLRENGPIPLVKLIISLEGDLKETVRLLSDMFANNTLKFESSG